MIFRSFYYVEVYYAKTGSKLNNFKQSPVTAERPKNAIFTRNFLETQINQ